MSTDINYIIQKSLNGDKNYQEILLQKLNPLIYMNIYVYWFNNDPLVEDLAQEGYAIILESLKTYSKKRNAHFLYYIKIKLIYFYKNSYETIKVRKRKTGFSINDDNKNFIPIEMSENKNILDNIIAKEEICELLLNIKKLSEKEQKILYLYYYKQMKMHEVSEILNIPYGTAVGRKQAAIKKLRKLINSRTNKL
jgi:RNA polymerase sigma factor (sigma-70 family)